MGVLSAKLRPHRCSSSHIALCCRVILLQEFLSSHGQPEDLIADVCAVVASVGFKEELAKKDGSSSSSSLSREAAVVQDADRSAACILCPGFCTC
jgi:hypothetical protein